ncbi:MAG: hypothetical protein ACPG8W_01560 [Candidatus Promineifilaceae bacterium]
MENLFDNPTSYYLYRIVFYRGIGWMVCLEPWAGQYPITYYAHAHLYTYISYTHSYTYTTYTSYAHIYLYTYTDTNIDLHANSPTNINCRANSYTRSVKYFFARCANPNSNFNRWIELVV